jgi:HEAT repeat protein
MFRSYAATTPMKLLELLPSLGDVDLSFAAEALGTASDSGLAVPALLALLDHRSAPVREGAIYGLEKHLERSGSARATLKRIATTDPSPGVRAAAQDALVLADEER